MTDHERELLQDHINYTRNVLGGRRSRSDLRNHTGSLIRAIAAEAAEEREQTKKKGR